MRPISSNGFHETSIQISLLPVQMRRFECVRTFAVSRIACTMPMDIAWISSPYHIYLSILYCVYPFFFFDLNFMGFFLHIVSSFGEDLPVIFLIALCQNLSIVYLFAIYQDDSVSTLYCTVVL